MLSLQEAINETEHAAGIHAAWIAYLEDFPEYAETVGNAKWHEHWLEVHMAAAYYLKNLTVLADVSPRWKLPKILQNGLDFLKGI